MEYTIYMIKDNLTNKIYIGSTTQDINTRYKQHRYCYNNYINGKLKKTCSSYEIMKSQNTEIKQLEKLICTPKKARIKEYNYIEQYKQNSQFTCVNKQNPMIKGDLNM